MASDTKDSQFIFEFNGYEGPEKPALEPEDNALLGLEDGAAGAELEEEDEEETWAPVVPPPAEEAPAAVAASEPAPAPEVAPVEAAPAPVVAEPAAAVEQPEAPEVAPVAVPVAPAAEPVKSGEPVVAEEPAVASAVKPLKPADIRRAALAWMAKQKPMAVATKVPTRLKRFCASVAAFWSEPGRRKRLLKPHRTAIIEIRSDREACFAESAKNAELLPALREAKARKMSLEAEIRIHEPQLKDNDYLFDDIESWNYAGTANKDYRQLLKRIEELERALHKGSKFELIRRAHVANELYLAVPEGAVHPDELAEGWGLIYISSSLEAALIRPASSMECPDENLMHLAQNIGAAALRDVLFSNGVILSADGSVSLLPPPRRRRPSTKL